MSSFKCKMGLHSWNGCKCTECDKIRDEQHLWEGCKCSGCNKVRDEKHEVKDCKCVKCGKEEHDFSIDCEKCSICGKIKVGQHDWSNDCEKCSICGSIGTEHHDWTIDCEKCSKCSKVRTNAHKWDGYKCSNCKQITKPSVDWKSIPAGTFLMGSPDSEIDRSEEVLHEVELTAFRISKYQVTFEEYDIFCEITDREKPDDEGWGRGKRPVINVDWDDATAYADWMDSRLPTEAEWEYACRAGTTTPFNTGANITTAEANYNGNSPYSNYDKGEFREMTMPVGSFKANAWQLHDMHGNVQEWCSDWHSDGAYYEYNASLTLSDPKGPETGTNKMFRGGSWETSAEFCRSACRFLSAYHTGKSNKIGFRLAKSW